MRAAMSDIDSGSDSGGLSALSQSSPCASVKEAATRAPSEAPSSAFRGACGDVEEAKDAGPSSLIDRCLKVIDHQNRYHPVHVLLKYFQLKLF